MSEKLLKNTKKVKSLIAKMNEVIATIRKGKKRQFDIFTEAYSSLSPSEFEVFKTEINLDKSSINKMIRICSSAFTVSNFDKLPTSWATLYVISGMNEDMVSTLISDEKITVKTTKEELLLLRDGDDYENLVSETDEYESSTAKTIPSVNNSANSKTATKNNNSKTIPNANNPALHWNKMPKCNNPKVSVYRELKVKFKTQKEFKAFEVLINQTLKKNVKSIWL